MVDDFKPLFNALRSEGDDGKSEGREPNPNDPFAELRGISDGWESEEDGESEYRVRLTSAWIFEVNQYANLEDYLSKPLRELLEALSVIRLKEKHKRQFLMAINGIKPR